MTSLVSWLRATLTCATVYTSLSVKHLNLPENVSQVVVSDEPWLLLNTWQNPPWSCITLLMDSERGYHLAKRFIDSSRIKTDMVLLLNNNSSGGGMEATFQAEEPNFDVHIAWLEGGNINGDYSLIWYSRSKKICFSL